MKYNILYVSYFMNGRKKKSFRAWIYVLVVGVHHSSRCIISFTDLSPACLSLSLGWNESCASLNFHCHPKIFSTSQVLYFIFFFFVCLSCLILFYMSLNSTQLKPPGCGTRRKREIHLTKAYGRYMTFFGTFSLRFHSMSFVIFHLSFSSALIVSCPK